jgi:hypothetical protein
MVHYIYMTSLPVPLPDGFTPIVAVGTVVTVGQVLAQKAANKEEIINILQSLNVSRSQIKKVLKKNPGDAINPGEIIAEKKNFFGKQQAAIVSSITGTILRYERDTGNLIIRTDESVTSSEVISPVDGTVDLCNNKEIVIRTDKAVTGGRVVSGINNTGELFILEESFIDDGSTNVLYYLDSRAIGKIILGGTFSRDVLIKGVGIGATGFLGLAIPDEDIAYLQEKKITIPVMEIDSESMQKLKTKQGKKVVLDTQNNVIIFQET